MRLKELNCKNCGATLKVEENATQVKCDFCNTSFAVEDAYTDGYKYEKGRLKAQAEHMEQNLEKAKGILGPIGKVFAAQYIISTVVAVVIFLVVLITIISIGISANKKVDDSRHNNDDIINDMETVFSDFDVKQFNNKFELYMGTEYGSSVGRLFDEIITNNKKNSNNQVTVVYNETTTRDPEEIKNLKKKFDDWTKYEVSFEYNDKGLIYLAKVED